MNAIGQRERVDRTGSAFGDSNAPHASVPSNPIDWPYDILGQMAKADYSDNILDQSYTYDQIGNRVSKTQTTASAQYTSNALNQFTSKTTSGSTENYLYDADGNLLSDGEATYTWDGEQCEPTSILDRSAATCPQGQNVKDECFDQNRLLSSTKNGQITSYQYDYLSRRIAKETNGITTEYVYDGWNPISEKTPTLTKYYTWGMDLSGSLQGAGGVGGLLSVTEISSDPNATQESVSNNAQHASVLSYPTYDGNGNVSEYLDSTGILVAHYEQCEPSSILDRSVVTCPLGQNAKDECFDQYDAFGNEIASKTTGSKANRFAYRFSTKPLDSETGFYYYGYRYYNPVTGTWPSRDPIEERGGVNLYGMVGNNPISRVDLLGLFSGGGGAYWPYSGNPNYPGYGDPPTYNPQSVINTADQALEHWRSKAGGSVAAGSGLIADIKNSNDYTSNKEAVEKAISKDLESVPCDQTSGTLTRQGKPIGIYAGNNAIGHVDLNFKTYNVNWTASAPDSQGNRTIVGVGHRTATFSDEYDFVWDSGSPFTTFFTDVVPSWIAGDGKKFNITGTITDSVVGEATQCCPK